MSLSTVVVLCLSVAVFFNWFEVFSTEKVDDTGFLINALQRVGEYFGIVLKHGLYQLASCFVFI